MTFSALFFLKGWIKLIDWPVSLAGCEVNMSLPSDGNVLNVFMLVL